MLFNLATIAALLPAALACFEGHNLQTQRLHARQVGGPVTPRTPPVYDWNYEDQDWAAIKPEYALCSSGQKQSPIALNTRSGFASTHKPDFSGARIGKVKGQFYNSGHGVYFTLDHPKDNYTTLPSMKFDDETVYLGGWHTHTPAEHTVNGNMPRAEIHFVWYTGSGTPRSVIGFHIQGGAQPSKFFSQYPTPWPSVEVLDKQVELTVDFSPLDAVANGFRQYFTYDGSLTTPGCSEGLRWFFNNNLFRVSAAQLKEIERVGGPHPSNRKVNAIKQHAVNV
ncbi:hypothetical protein C1H76_6915 [Elsinoe australis]|uniref:Alpha-carbonic anhydrase domain-containing protein n=1 Tax=Elsinoe australis TaxID=40998 RepID=A0A4U7ARK0_9PEZI|nr:hypothetical protein C1H76_6915 [Elsinoe australis]